MVIKNKPSVIYDPKRGLFYGIVYTYDNGTIISGQQSNLGQPHRDLAIMDAEDMINEATDDPDDD